MKLYPVNIDTSNKITISIDVVEGEIKIIVSDSISEIELFPEQVARTTDMLLLAQQKADLLSKSITEICNVQ